MTEIRTSEYRQEARRKLCCIVRDIHWIGFIDGLKASEKVKNSSTLITSKPDTLEETFEELREDFMEKVINEANILDTIECCCSTKQ